MPNAKSKIREARIPPQIVRLMGIELNNGRVHGWTERLSVLLDTPPLTIRSWASGDPNNYRPISGSAATLLTILVKLQRSGEDVDRFVSEAEDRLATVLAQLDDAQASVGGSAGGAARDGRRAPLH